MEEIIIKYTIEIYTGPKGGETVEEEITLEDIETDGIALTLINRGYFECSVSGSEFDVIKREIL